MLNALLLSSTRWRPIHPPIVTWQSVAGTYGCWFLCPNYHGCETQTLDAAHLKNIREICWPSTAQSGGGSFQKRLRFSQLGASFGHLTCKRATRPWCFKVFDFKCASRQRPLHPPTSLFCKHTSTTFHPRDVSSWHLFSVTSLWTASCKSPEVWLTLTNFDWYNQNDIK